MGGLNLNRPYRIILVYTGDIGGYDEMDNTKYGKYILWEPFGKAAHPEIQVPVISVGRKSPVAQWGGVPFNMTMEPVSSPVSMGGHGHTHDFEEFLCFFGFDPMNYRDFAAEAYIILGDEKEKHIIDRPSVIYIPPGLEHCPLVFTRVDKPVVFGFVQFSPYFIANKKPEDL